MRYVHFIIQYVTCPHLESFVIGGPTLTIFFSIVDEGREVPKTTKTRPSLAHLQHTIECWLGSFVIFRGSRAVLL